MSNTTDQQRLSALFQAKVASFETKVPQRFHSLHPFKDGIADLRSKQASFRTIADLLNQLGVEVSHNTVARFCAQVLNGKPARQRFRKQPSKPAKPTPDIKVAVQAKRQSQVTSASPVPTPSDRRGPRIADPKNV